MTKHSRLSKWKETNEDEIYLFLAVTFLIARNPKLSLSDCWSRDCLLNTPIFSDTISRDRYLLLLRLLHFCDNEQQEPGDRLFKLDAVLSELRMCFRENFIPFRNLCIDETMIPFKGRLSFRQFVKGKKHKFGVKLFVLADTETDYILNFIVYTGSSTKLPVFYDELGVSGNCVVNLIERYLKKGHCLFTDNWYTSPRLARFLHENQTNCCGTVRNNRKEMPKFTKNLKRGERRCMSTDKIMVLQWRDKRIVHMLTTFHEDTVVTTAKTNRETGESIVKPLCIDQYNKNMGTIDKVDMLLSPVNCLHKSVKWYKKVFFFLMDYALLNAYSMWKVYTGEQIPLAKFQLELIRQMIEKYKKKNSNSRGGRPSSGDVPNRLIDRHFPSLVPGSSGRRNRQRVCYVCAHTQRKATKRVDSRYQCEDCNVGLCIPDCFRIFHTVKHF